MDVLIKSIHIVMLVALSIVMLSSACNNEEASTKGKFIHFKVTGEQRHHDRNGILHS